MSHTLKVQLNKTWIAALKESILFLSPSIWFLGGIFKTSIIGQLESLCTGFLFIGFAIMYARIFQEISTRREIIDEIAEYNQGIGMMKTIDHFKNGGDVDGLLAKIRSKSPIEKLNNK